MRFNFADLFAGVGGFHFAMSGLAKCVFASEWDKNARTTYEANWGEELKENSAIFAGDITSVNHNSIPDFDILCGGFPCQPFSIAGKQLGFAHATQGTLFFNIIELISIKKPRVVFLENVKNLTSHDNGNTFNKYQAEFPHLLGGGDECALRSCFLCDKYDKIRPFLNCDSAVYKCPSSKPINTGFIQRLNSKSSLPSRLVVFALFGIKCCMKK